MPPFNLRRPLTPALQTLTTTTTTTIRTLRTTPLLLKQPQHHNPPRLQLPDSEIKHVFILGGGNGGQVINKTSSAAQLTHIPTGIVVKSQATRSRSQNYKIARQILADKVDEKLNGEKSRTQVKQAHVSKKKSSADKKKRRKYRALEEAKNGEVQVDGDEDGGADEISEDGGGEYEGARQGDPVKIPP